MKLGELQRRFKTEMERGLEPASARRLGISDRTSVPARRRLAIYGYAYWARQVESLEEDFPSLIRALGASGFRKLAREYLKAYPSRYASLAELGRDLETFLRNRPGHARRPWLAELARLDWLRFASSAAADASPLGPADWVRAGGDPDAFERAVLELHPSARVLRSGWAVHLDESKPPRRETRLAIHRRDGDVAVRELSEEQCSLLEAVAAGEPVGALIARLVRFGVSPERTLEWFRAWAADGMICRIRI